MPFCRFTNSACLQFSYSLQCVFWMKPVQCLSVGRCACVNNLLFQTSLSPSSLLVGCMLSWQVVETGKLQSNICLPVWQASPLKGRELFRPSAGALQGVGWWGRDTCSSLKLTPCTHLFPIQCDQSGKQGHWGTATVLRWFYRRVGHKLRGVKHYRKRQRKRHSG